jgi:hypothetical protein
MRDKQEKVINEASQMKTSTPASSQLMNRLEKCSEKILKIH